MGENEHMVITGDSEKLTNTVSFMFSLWSEIKHRSMHERNDVHESRNLF